MADMQFVDGMLITWGSQLFYGRVKAKKGTVRDLVTFKLGRGERQERYTLPSAQEVRDRLRATFKKVPEVNIKITSSGKHMTQIKAHIDYIARTDEEDPTLHKTLEDQDGNLFHGRDDLFYLRDAWRDGRNIGIPSEIGSKRETFNIMFSMPPGTNREGVHNAVRDFAAAEFGGKHSYVFTSHDDTAHPHAHMIVKALGKYGARLNPRKADLQRWRRGFADKLREHGIEANATTKRSRGIIRHPLKKSVIEAEQAGKTLPNYQDRNANPDNPYAAKTASTHGKVLRTYRGIAEALKNSPDVADRRLAVDLVGFISSMPYELEHAAQQRANIKPQRIEPALQPGKDRGGK